MNRTELIQSLIDKNQYRNYLEIGVSHGRNFSAIKCPVKIGVDPDKTTPATHHITSDAFFQWDKYRSMHFDLIFIDGLHHCVQVYKDVQNALARLSDSGTIVCHDMKPDSKTAQIVPRQQTHWMGDCWMAWVWLRATRPDLEMFVIDADCGLGIIRRGKQTPIVIDRNITFENLNPKWLNLVTPANASKLL